MHLERLALILEIVGQKGQATVTDICAHSDLPKPSAYRLVQDLVAVGLLESSVRGQFTIGARLKRITQRDHSDEALLDLISPMLKEAARKHGAAFFLSRLRGLSVEIIHVEVPETGVSYLHPGIGKRPLHACSCSKAIAAFSPELLSKVHLQGRLRAYTKHTLTTLDELEAEFEVIRHRGYAQCIEELERGICSVATTLAESGPGAALSIGATGSARVFTPDTRDKIGRVLKEMSHDISCVLGWTEADAGRKTA